MFYSPPGPASPFLVQHAVPPIEVRARRTSRAPQPLVPSFAPRGLSPFYEELAPPPLAPLQPGLSPPLPLEKPASPA